MKYHAAILHGVIVELEPQLGYGFVRADDGKQVYFQKDSLVSGDWNALEIGTRLRFREQDGENGHLQLMYLPALSGLISAY